MDTLLIDSTTLESLTQSLQALTDTLAQRRTVIVQAPAPTDQLTTKDWFSISAAAATVISLIYLMIKDYRKSRKIDHLETLAEQAQAQVGELRKQTETFSEQVEEFRQQSRELKAQTHAQTEMSLTLAKSLNAQLDAKRPILEITGSSIFQSREFKFHIKNNGERGWIISIEVEEAKPDISTQIPKLPYDLPSGEVFMGFCFQPVNKNDFSPNDLRFTLKIKHKSISGICYQQVFRCNGNGDLRELEPNPVKIECE